jgi:hypothetical protein
MGGGGGGRGIPIWISTAAIVAMGKALTNAKSTVPKSNFFMLLPPFLFFDFFPSIKIPYKTFLLQPLFID